MNTKPLLVLSLAGCVSAQAGVTDNYLDRLSPKAREFVEKYKAEKTKKLNNTQKRKVVLKSDVLGRKAKQGKVQDSTVYVVEDVVEPKMEVTVYDLTVETPDIESLGPAHYSYNEKTKEENYWLNGKKIDKKSFFKKTEEWENRRMKLQKPLKEPYKAFLTPTEMERKLQSSENIYIETENPSVETENFYFGQYEDPVGTVSTYVATLEESLIISQLGAAHAAGDKGQGIGVYYMDTGCADPSLIPNSSHHQFRACNRKNRSHATQVTTILQTYAPEAFIYGYDRQNIENTLGPSNPNGSSFNPKIYVGNISIGVGDGDNHTANYEYKDAYLDNYIFANGVTEFVSAGNFEPSRQNQRTIHSPGKALNAITVGAYNPYPFYLNGNTVPTYIYEVYSNYINSNIGNAKPEIMNMGNIYLPNGQTYTGTSIASPLSAAMAADLMSRHPFFKGHPEMVKPVFMTATWGTTFNNLDTDAGAIEGIPAYGFMAYNKTYSGYWPKAKGNVLFKDANGNHKNLEMNISGVVAGEKYKLGVSWLMQGTTIKSKGKMPVNLGVFVYQNGLLIISSADMMNKNPFALLPFTIPQSGTIKIIIACLSNVAPNDEIAVGYHMALQTAPTP